eukprot:COSAG06_NODE_4584_length_4125_cov_103.384501_2_plen_120_part_00
MAAGLIMFRCQRGGNENAGRRCRKAQLSSSLFLTVTFDRDLSPMMQLSRALRASKLALRAPGLRGFQPRAWSGGGTGPGGPPARRRRPSLSCNPNPTPQRQTRTNIGAWPHYARGQKSP